MAPNSLFPAFVQVNYHSEFSPHVMTLPTRAWSAGGGTAGSGTFDAWDSSAKDAHAMILALVELIDPFFKSTTSFDNYTIYTMDAPDATPTPVYANELGEAGSSIQTQWHKAVQTTFTFRTDLFGIFKLVLLDAPSGGLFDKILSFAASPEALAIRDELADSANAWAGRDGGQITVLSQIAYTLNEKLRREYNMN